MEVAEKKTEIEELQDSSINNQPFAFRRKGIVSGMIAGIGMTLYLLILHTVNETPSSALKFMKYIIMAGLLGITLYQHKNSVPFGKTFKRGAMLGGLISAVAALTTIVANTIIFLTASDLTIGKFGRVVDTFPDLLIINGIIFIEIFVYGMILAFIWLQLYKEPKPAE